MLYPWHEKDFVGVPAHELKKGDEIAFPGLDLEQEDIGNETMYAAIPIIGFHRYREDSMTVIYHLPVGIGVHSISNRAIDIIWQGDQPVISIWEYFHPNERVLIRRK